jgi:hypothetical protein
MCAEGEIEDVSKCRLVEYQGPDIGVFKQHVDSDNRDKSDAWQPSVIPRSSIQRSFIQLILSMIENLGILIPPFV